MNLIVALVLELAVFIIAIVFLCKVFKVKGKPFKIIAWVGFGVTIALMLVTAYKSEVTKIDNLFSPTSTTEPKTDSNGFPIENDREWFNK